MKKHRIIAISGVLLLVAVLAARSFGYTSTHVSGASTGSGFNNRGVRFKPWGMASNQGLRKGADGSIASFLVSNTNSAAIDRIDVISSAQGTTFRVFQIEQLTRVNSENDDNTNTLKVLSA
ncbi:MAG TPA: hypothetical protein VKV40_09100 [Ktedonobacteraceae bacterium]|nr:hypothetical protein [Ktedonobacteraceae bacterium]